MFRELQRKLLGQLSEMDQRYHVLSLAASRYKAAGNFPSFVRCKKKMGAIEHSILQVNKQLDSIRAENLFYERDFE